jgi:hypothetical protein
LLDGGGSRRGEKMMADAMEWELVKRMMTNGDGRRREWYKVYYVGEGVRESRTGRNLLLSTSGGRSRIRSSSRWAKKGDGASVAGDYEVKVPHPSSQSRAILSWTERLDGMID